MGKNAKKYFQEVKRRVSVYNIDKRKFLNDIKTSLDEYENKNVDCTYNDYVAEFGKPEDVVKEYVQEIFEENIHLYMRKLNKKYSVMELCSIAALSISILTGIAALCSLHDKNRYTEYQEEISIIEEKQDFRFTIEQVNGDGSVKELAEMSLY